MMLDWNQYQKQVLTQVAEIGKMSPDTLRGYRSLTDAGNKANPDISRLHTIF